MYFVVQKTLKIILFLGDDIKRRLKSLRTDMSRILKVGPSGRGVDGKIDPNKLHNKDKALWEKLSFLNEFIKPRETRSTSKVFILFKINLAF